MAKGDDIYERLMDLAVRTIKLSESLPKTAAGRHIGKQVLRSGTAAGANYQEARGSESRADFAHKMGIVLKELKETGYWLNLAARSGMVKPARLERITGDCEELCAIAGRSITTARKRLNEQ